MTEEEHNSVAAMLVGMAAGMAQSPHTALVAGELIWGAAIHACVVIAHRAGRRPQHPRQKRELDRLLNQAVADPTLRAGLVDGLNMAQKRLHNHFYTGQLSNTELARHLTSGFEFVEQLQRIAAQSTDGGGNATTV